MYSVVETKEKSRLVVTAVPTSWIVGDHLLWPDQVKNKVELDELLRDPSSIPEASWKSQRCSVRASNIENYFLALAVEKAFLNCSDTDEEQITLKEIIRKPLPLSGTSVLNEKLQKLFQKESDKPLDRNPGEEPIVIAEIIASTSHENNENYNGIPPPLQNCNKDEQHIPIIIKNITEVIHTELEKKINPVIESIYRLETKLDEVLKKFNQPLQCFQEEDISWCNYKFPLDTIQEVERLEKELLSTSFYKKMAEYLLRKTCAKDTKDVKKVTKRLLTELFTLDVLKCYSWTGRGKIKPAFSSLHRILNLILDIEKQADSTYNEQKSTDFLQNRWFKCLNQTIRRTKLKTKPHIDSQVENQATVLEDIVTDIEENL